MAKIERTPASKAPMSTDGHQVTPQRKEQDPPPSIAIMAKGGGRRELYALDSENSKPIQWP